MTTIRKKNRSSLKPNPDFPKGNEFAKFSGLAFELLGILIVGVGSGYGLDLFFENSVPFLTIVFSLLAFVGMIVYLLRRLPKD